MEALYRTRLVLQPVFVLGRRLQERALSRLKTQLIPLGSAGQNKTANTYVIEIPL